MNTELTPTAELLRRSSRRQPPRTAIIAMALAGAIAIGGGGFAVGRSTAPTPQFQGVRGNGNGFPGGGGVGGGFRGGLQGTVDSISGTTITLKTASGSTLMVNLSGSTTYSKQVTGQKGDITIGSTIRVGIASTGANPTSGTVDATSVTLMTP